MNLKSLLQDIVRGNFKALHLRLKLAWRRLMRRLDYHLHKQNYDSLDVRDIPVVINNFNRLSYLKQLLNWLEARGMREIYILDNKSSYPALLEFYKTCKHPLILLNSNLGYRALWLCKELEHICSGFYIYTDPDVVPDKDCPDDLIQFMYDQLKSDFTVDKIGVGLKIDDLPENYDRRLEVMNWEGRFQGPVLPSGLVRAPVDTTFALYAPFTRGGGENKAYRTVAPYLALHLPWYENSSDPGEENLYYIRSASTSSHWTSKTNQD